MIKEKNAIKVHELIVYTSIVLCDHVTSYHVYSYDRMKRFIIADTVLTTRVCNF